MAQLHQPRLADIIAARLRSDILSGRYQEGEVLDIAGGVLADFSVSLPAMREAVRVLENEGLLRTRRGSGGGVVVQLPTPRRIGEVIAMVLQARRTEPSDVGRALAHFEPICASMCAERPDRHVSVLPDLRRIIKSQRDQLDDRPAYMSNARAFHDSIVDHCGSETMVVAAGALEAIWSAHATALYTGDVPGAAGEDLQRRLAAAVDQHEKVVDAIDAGDGDLAARLLREHIAFTQRHEPNNVVLDVVDASLIAEYRGIAEQHPVAAELPEGLG
jgi:GntR family transcriptional regulator, transcriptional repressor for pyruvate dehydrogenase complex